MNPRNGKKSVEALYVCTECKKEIVIHEEYLLGANIICPHCHSEMAVKKEKDDKSITGLLLIFLGSILFMLLSWYLLFLLTGCSSFDESDEAITIKVVRCIDGDTFVCNIQNDSLEVFTKNISVRIRGIDAPELNDKRPEIRKLALETKEYVSQRLASAHRIELKNLGRDKYFRILADVYVDGSNLSEELIAKGYCQTGR